MTNRWEELPAEQSSAPMKDLGDLFQIFRLDGGKYEPAEWPVLRSLKTGEVVVGEEFFRLAPDGSRRSFSFNCAPFYDDHGRIAGAVAVARDTSEQKHSQEQLAYLLPLLDHTADAIIAFDLKWRTTAWNRGAERMYGWSAEEALGRELRSFMRVDMSDRQHTELRREIAERGRWRGEVDVGRKDGSVVSVESINVAIRDSHGEITGYLTIHRNVTERKLAEEAEREANRRAESIIERVSDAFVAVDTDWRYTYLNEPALVSARIAHGGSLTRGDLLGKNCWEAFPELVGTTFDRELHAALAQQKAVRFEAYSPRTDSFIEVQAYPSKDGLSIYSRDVTERKRAEEQLRYHASLLDNMDDAVLGTDAEFVLTAWNRGAERMFGWTAAEALGHKVYELIPTSFSEAEMATELRDLVTTGRWRGEGTWYGKDGAGVEAEGLTVAIRSDQGNVSGYVCIMRDVAQRRRTELELERRLRQQAAVAELGLQALGGERLSALMDAAVTMVSRTLGVEYAKLDQLLPGSDELVVAAGAGWGEGIVGIHRIPADRRSSPAGYALALGEPVIVEDMAAETRFEVPRILHEHGVLSDVTVVIGQRGNPFGAIAAMSKERRSFSEHDVSFVQSVANVIATAVARAGTERRLETTARAQALLADLSLRALGTNHLRAVLDDAVGLVADVLSVELCLIAEVEPGREQLSWRAAFGWSKDELASAPASRPGTGSLVGYTISIGEPVISEDVDADERFAMSPMFADRRLVSAAAVVIPGPERPFGALVATTRTRRSFGSADIEFMQAVANVIANAVDHASGNERIEAARRAERGRIAQDLHDEVLREVIDALALATMARSSSADDQDEHRWSTLINTLQQGARWLRSAIYDLKLSDDDRPFGDLLGELVEIQSEVADDRQIELQGRDALGAALLGDRGTELLRIVTEALTNSRRHSGASAIKVDVSASTVDVLRLEVCDDGAWPDRELVVRTRAGTGIMGMFRRAEALGAKLRLEGGPGGGTTVSLEFALADERSDE
jgi:PAS domain S-box-containing protein